MTIDPRIAFWFGVWTFLLLGLANGSGHLPSTFSKETADQIISWAGFLAWINSGVLTAASGYSSSRTGPMVNAVIPPGTKAAIILAIVLGSFLAAPSAHAQIKFKPLPDPLKLNQAAAQAKAVITGQPAPDSTTALPCDFKMLTKLTPDNLIPTMKACLSDVNSQLVNDTQRALDSAKVYGGTGDGDGVNCLTPGLAIFKAGVQVPAVPAVIAADGTVTTPAVPAQDPGPILLYQKYREFTLSGALTSCQSWFNGPINATAAAGLAGAGTALAGAALLVPK